MSSNVKAVALTSAVVMVMAIMAAASAIANGGPVEVTEARAKACAKAQAAYEKLYPNALKDENVEIVLTYKYNFCPANVTVKVGTTVRWVNVDRRTSHSVWLKEAQIEESERFFPEEQWEYTFLTPGKYPYLCGPHWKDEEMIGYVEVVE